MKLTLHVDVTEDLILVDEYWDCSCDKNYIHQISEDRCKYCGDIKDESPSSRLNEVIAQVFFTYKIVSDFKE